MASETKKNVLLISFDDAVAFWKYKSIFGETLQTPNFDRICAQSTSFQSAYCQVPVCSPSRASFMSGISPHQSGIVQSDAHYFDKISPKKMWPYRLKSRGYYCSTGGKVMRGYRALPTEVHETIYSDKPKKLRMGRQKNFYADGKIPDHIEFGGFRGGMATTTAQSDKDLYDNQVAESAMYFLNNYDEDAPFYRDVGFQSPHGPWTTPLRFKEMYNAQNFKQPKDWAGGFVENAIADEICGKTIDNSRIRFWQKSVRNYFSSLSYADYQLGRVWDALKSSRHAENTLVVILSDHGLHLGERDRFTKCSLWEQVANVPLIIHDPAQPAGQVVSDPVGLIDVGPTVMEYLGLPPLDDSPGRSLLAQMNWERDPDRAVPTFYFGNAGVRKGKYRFIRYSDGSTQLFDLSQDWWQTHNLGEGHPDYQKMKEAHAACCKEYGLDLRAELAPS